MTSDSFGRIPYDVIPKFFDQKLNLRKLFLNAQLTLMRTKIQIYMKIGMNLMFLAK